MLWLLCFGVEVLFDGFQGFFRDVGSLLLHVVDCGKKSLEEVVWWGVCLCCLCDLWEG